MLHRVCVASLYVLQKSLKLRSAMPPLSSQLHQCGFLPNIKLPRYHLESATAFLPDFTTPTYLFALRWLGLSLPVSMLHADDYILTYSKDQNFSISSYLKIFCAHFLCCCTVVHSYRMPQPHDQCQTVFSISRLVSCSYDTIHGWRKSFDWGGGTNGGGVSHWVCQQHVTQFFQKMPSTTDSFAGSYSYMAELQKVSLGVCNSCIKA